MPTPAATKPPVATSVDTSAESATTSLYRAAIGPINNDYYLPVFTRFEALNRVGPSWNPSACLYTLNWMVFRQMWRAAGLYLAAVLGAALILAGAGYLLQLPESTEWGLWLALAVLGFVLPGLYGNAWYHAACRQKMASALTASATLREACAWLYQRASTRQRFIQMGVVNLLLAAVALGAYVVISQRAPTPPVAVKPGADHQQRVGKLTVEPAPAVAVPAEPAASAAVGVASAPAVMASAAASAAPAPTPPPVPDQAFQDAMAVAMARYVPRRAVTTAATPDAAPTAVPAPVPVASEPTPARKKADSKVKEKEKEKPKAKTKAEDADKSYAINVGLFANGANALNAYTRLVDAGLPALMQEVDTAKGQRTRVRVGPIRNRAEAEAAVRKIRALQLEAMLIQLP